MPCTWTPEHLNLRTMMRLIDRAEFRAMTAADSHGFAGADPGTLIAELDEMIILQNPEGGEYGGGHSFIAATDAGEMWQVDLKIERVI